MPVCPSSFSRNVSGTKIVCLNMPDLTKIVCLNMPDLSGIANLQHNNNRWSVPHEKSSIHLHICHVCRMLFPIGRLTRFRVGPFFNLRAIGRVNRRNTSLVFRLNHVFQEANSSLVFQSFQIWAPETSQVLLIVASDTSLHRNVKMQPL